MAKCSACNYTSGHTSWCPVGNPKPRSKQAPPQKNKQNFKKRDDDGRSSHKR